MDNIFSKWINKYKIKNDKKPQLALSYFHLDPKLKSRIKGIKDLNTLEINQKVENYLNFFYKKYLTLQGLSRHCFLPLLKIEIPKFKYILDIKTKKRKLHKYKKDDLSSYQFLIH